MSLFGKLFRTAAVSAAVVVGAGSATAQDYAAPAPALLANPWFASPSPEPVEPVSGFGGRVFGPRTAPGCGAAPCQPCTPATPCPVTGQPMTLPPTQSTVTQPASQALDVGDRGAGADVGPTTGLGGYIENAMPNSMIRLRFDSAYNNNRPDRGEFFYAKSAILGTPNARGPGLRERSIDYQELTTTAEVAFAQRISAFFDIPVRFINPDVNQNAAGIGDVGFGMKYAAIYTPTRVVSAFLRFQAPSGSISKGLGNGNWWIEPGVLWLEQLSQKWQLFGEFRFQTPLAPRSDFTGNLFRYGLGTSYIIAQGRSWYIAPVAEVVGWTVLSGKETDLDTLQVVRAAGDTIVNAKFGVRIGFGAPGCGCGSPYLTRNDLYIGYGRALTGEVWYKDLLRFELRRFF